MLVSAEDLESMEATVELLSDEAAIDRIRQAEADVAAEELTLESEMADMQQRGQRERGDT